MTTPDLSSVSTEDLAAALKAAKDEPTTPPEDLVILDEDGEVSSSKELATPDEQPPWAHIVIDFLGDKLEVRKPTEQALAGFSLASGKYIPQKLQNDLVSLFIKQHMSADSLERVFFRLLDPDDAEYEPATIGELMKEIALLP